MNLSINGQCKVPPGFRFHPTEEELLQYYLKKKVAQEMIDLDVIPCVDLNKLEPWDIQEKCRIGSGPQNEWYFFSRKDKKYPSGTRTNRATEVGFWKATGRDKIVYNNSKRIGLRKTLVFYIGRAPSGQKSDWIMYEYRLEENTDDANNVCQFGELNAEDWWVVCRLFKKKNCKAKESPENSSTSPNMSSDQAQFSSPHMVTYSKQENKSNSEIINMINNNNNAKLQASINTILSEMKTPSNPLLGNSIGSALDDDRDANYEICGYTVDNILPGIEYSNCDNRYPYGVNIESYEELGFSQIVQHLQLPYLCSSTPNQATEVYSNDVELWSFT